MSSQELVQTWGSQLEDDIKPIPADVLWGAMVGACLAHRLQIQENVRRGLAVRTGQRGVDVTDVALLDVHPSNPL